MGRSRNCCHFLPGVALKTECGLWQRQFLTGHNALPWRVNLEAGMSVDEITEVFDVTAGEVKAVLHSASQSLAKAPEFG
jgi:hypothetical protein